jgi:hypothetical protein
VPRKETLSVDQLNERGQRLGEEKTTGQAKEGDLSWLTDYRNRKQ